MVCSRCFFIIYLDFTFLVRTFAMTYYYNYDELD